jgi:phosphatidylserine/phosphatidylglycerophosphate/cardiolipin synthase-like enzyme
LSNSYIAFCSHISSTSPADVFLLDKYFKYNRFQRVLSQDHIDISNSSRKIELRGDKRTLDYLMESIHKVKISSPWVRQHRFDSYAPIRENAKIKWYIDGKDYFFAVSQAILAAKSEIYIEDWWLSPELVSIIRNMCYVYIIFCYSNNSFYSTFADLLVIMKIFD